MDRHTPLTDELVAPVAEAIHRARCHLRYAGMPCSCADNGDDGRFEATAVMSAYRDDPEVTAAFAQASSIDLLIQGFIEKVIGPSPVAPIKAIEQAREFADDPSVATGADVVLAVMIDLAQRGHTWVEVKSAVIAKARRNLGRMWIRDEQGIFQHEAEEGQE